MMFEQIQIQKHVGYKKGNHKYEYIWFENKG